MNILIRADLTNPPTWTASFRDLTLYVCFFMGHVILLESEKDDVDIYYSWLKSKGCMDFVSDFVEPGVESGYRIDTQNRFPMTIVVTDRIIPENTHQIINRLNFWARESRG